MRPLMMVDGLGWVWKRWVITEVDETKSVFLRDGGARARSNFRSSCNLMDRMAVGGLSSFIGGAVLMATYRTIDGDMWMRFARRILAAKT